MRGLLYLIKVMSLQPIHHLLAKEVDRKEFLLYVGLLLLAVTGISGMLKTVSTITEGKSEKGFGSGGYGV